MMWLWAVEESLCHDFYGDETALLLFSERSLESNSIRTLARAEDSLVQAADRDQSAQLRSAVGGDEPFPVSGPRGQGTVCGSGTAG